MKLLTFLVFHLCQSLQRILEGNLYVLPVATKFVPCLLSESLNFWLKKN